jgi:hypothetical protein
MSSRLNLRYQGLGLGNARMAGIVSPVAVDHTRVSRPPTATKRPSSANRSPQTASRQYALPRNVVASPMPARPL